VASLCFIYHYHTVTPRKQQRSEWIK